MPKTISDILSVTAMEFRKGSDLIINGQPATDEQRAQLEQKDGLSSVGGVVEMYMMPHESEARPGLVMVDCHFIKVGIDKDLAEIEREHFVAWLDENMPKDREVGYMELGGIVGSQDMALEIMALGEALGLWKILTPEVMHMPKEMWDPMAGMGMVTVSGYRSQSQLA